MISFRATDAYRPAMSLGGVGLPHSDTSEPSLGASTPTETETGELSAASPSTVALPGTASPGTGLTAFDRFRLGYMVSKPIKIVIMICASSKREEEARDSRFSYRWSRLPSRLKSRSRRKVGYG